MQRLAKEKKKCFMMFSLVLKFGHSDPKVQKNLRSKTFFVFFSLFFHLAESWALGRISIWQWMNLTDFILLLNNYVDQRNKKRLVSVKISHASMELFYM